MSIGWLPCPPWSIALPSRAGCREEVRQGELPIVSGTRIGEVPFDQSIKAETFVQRAREQQLGIGGDRCAAELDAKLGISPLRMKMWVRRDRRGG